MTTGRPEALPGGSRLDPTPAGASPESRAGTGGGHTREVALRIVLPLVGGALVGLSLPPLLPWPLGIIGAGLVVAALSGRSWKGRLAVGFLAGIGQFSVALTWALQFNSAGYVALVILESLILGVGAALVPAAGALRVPAAAGAFTLAEWVRQSWPFGGLPLGSAALGQIGGPLQFTARLGGPLIVVLALVLAGGALAELVTGPRRATAMSWLIGVAALSGAGAVAAPAIPASAHDRLRVAIVQGGGIRGLTELQVPPSHVLQAALQETSKITGRPQLILWPEDVVSMGATPFPGSAVEHELAAIARRYHATFIAGVTEDVGATRFRNEVVAFSPEGDVVATYEKVHRVPFGEYVPWRSFFSHLANLKDVPRDAIPGTGSGMVATPAGRFGVLISYEVFFAERGRSGVRAGGEVILVPTNTSSYSSNQAPAQEIAASRLQALEEGRYVVQAAPTGYSAVITPSGVVIRRSPLSSPDVIEATVTKISGTTPYADAGDLPILIGSAALLALGWMTAVGRRRERPGTEPPRPAAEA